MATSMGGYGDLTSLSNGSQLWSDGKSKDDALMGQWVDDADYKYDQPQDYGRKLSKIDQAVEDAVKDLGGE